MLVGGVACLVDIYLSMHEYMRTPLQIYAYMYTLVGGVACDASDGDALLACPRVHGGGLLHLVFCAVLMSFLCGVCVLLL